MLIEERFGVLFPWKDYFKRLKKKKRLRKGSEGRETGRRRKIVHRVDEFKVSQEILDQFFARNISPLNNCPFSPFSPDDYSSMKIEHRGKLENRRKERKEEKRKRK